MNSDENSSTVNNKVAQREATTEAIMSSDGSGQSMIDSDPVGKLTVNPAKIDSIKKSTVVVQNQLPIDITSGRWFDLPLLYRADTAGPTFTSDGFIGSIPINYFMGILTQYDLNQTTNNNLMYTSDFDLIRFINFKLDSVTQKFKNFNILIERDESGGLQVQDPMIFQIRRVYYGRWNAGGTQYPDSTAFSLSDLSHGITSHFEFTNLGWIQAAAIAAPSGAYSNLEGLIGDKPTNTQFGLYPETVPYRWQMRLANFGTFTNVTVWLSYISEINANWTAQGALLGSQPLPLPDLPAAATEEPKKDNTIKKRKLISINE